MASLRFLSVVVFAPALLAQTSIHGSLRGRVLDPAGLGVPDARLRASNKNSGAASTALSGGDGTFEFGRLAPGAYSITVTKPGFRVAAKEFVEIALSETLRLDIALSLGETAETVTIASDPGIVQTQRVELSGRVDERRVRELPLNGENFHRLVLLAPGVAGGSANNFAVSGARPVANTYTVDGVTTSDERGQNGLAIGGGGAAEFSGGSPNLVSTEAIQEFAIVTSNADATFGRGSGAQVNIVTKSGSNELHGSLYHYLRNDKLDARDFFNYGPFFDSQSRSIVPPFKQNLFGGSAGGPIARNKHFYFGSFEGFRQRLEQTASAVLPNAALIGLIPGDLGRLYRLFYIDRGIVPSTGNPAGSFSPLTAAERTTAINGGFPRDLFDANLSNGEAGTSLASTANTRNIDQHTFLVRTDHQLTRKLNVSARYGFAEPSASTNTRAVAGVAQENKRRWQSGTAQFVYAASPSQIVEWRGGLLRTRMRDAPRDPLERSLVDFGVDAELGLQVFASGSTLSRLTIPGSTGFIDNQTVPQGAAMHTWTRGRLTLRSGADVRRLNLNVLLISNASTFQFTGLVGPNGLIGARPGQAQAVFTELNTTLYGVNGGPTTPLRGWRSTEQEYFTQADYRLRKSLTLNLGLRYSLFGTYSPVGNYAGNLYAVNPANSQIVPGVSAFRFGAFANVAAPVTGSRPFHQPDRNNWQPRLGAAWDLGARGHTVLRAAYGVYADRFYQRLFDFGVLNPPFAQSAIFTNQPFPERVRIPQVNTSPPQGRFINPALRNPNTHRFQAAIERRIATSTSVTAAYVGSRGSGLYRQAEPNGLGSVPNPVRPDQRYSRYRYLDNAVESYYDALQLFARHRFTKGVDFTVAYTHARSIDDGSGTIAETSALNQSTGQPQFPTLINLGGSPAAGFQGGRDWAPRPIHAERGYSDFDLRRSLVVSHIVEIPVGRGRRLAAGAPRAVDWIAGGWSVAGLLTLRSGLAVYPAEGSDYADIGIANALRPALLRGTLDDLYARGQFDRTQFYLPKPQIDSYLGVPANVLDPYAPIRRNALQGPASQVYDVSFLKRFTVRERVSIGVEANLFNVFNSAVFGSPIATVRDVRFGRVVNTVAGSNPRQVQLGMKLKF